MKTHVSATAPLWRIMYGATIGLGFLVVVGGVLLLLRPTTAASPSVAHTTPATSVSRPGAGAAPTALHVALEVAPNAFGPNRFLVTVRDGQGRPINGAVVTLQLTMRDMPMGRTTLSTVAVGGGRYQAMNSLPMPGHWQVVAQVGGLPHGVPGGSASFIITSTAHATAAVPAALPPLKGSIVAPVPTTIAPSAVRWSGLPYRAVVSFIGSGRIYLPNSGSLLQTGQLNHSVVRAPSGLLWTTDYDGNSVAIVRQRTGRVLAQIPVGLGPVHIAFSPDGYHAYVSDFLSGEVSVINIPMRRVVRTIAVGLQPHGLAISPDGREVWVPCGMSGGIWVLDTQHSDRVARIIPTGLGPHAVAFSPDGRTVYMTDYLFGNLVVIDRASGRVGTHILIGTGSAMVAVARDGGRVYVTGQGDSVLSVVAVATHHVVARIPVGGQPHGLTLTPDGHYLYVAANAARQVTVVNTVTDRVVATVPVPGQADEIVLSQ